MNVLNQFRHFLARRIAPKPFRNQYEAAVPVQPGRPWLPAWVRDARYDATAFARWEITRKVRFYFENTFLLSRLAEVDCKYTVGPHGLCAQPVSSDPDWNERFSEAYQEWREEPFRDSKLSMADGQWLLWKECHMDGEVFANLTSLKVAGRKIIPAIECIESHRCSAPGLDYDWPSDSSNIIDGVELLVDASGNRTGRAAAFSIRDGFDGSVWHRLAAYDCSRPMDGGVIQIYDPERIGMPRAVSGYASVINETDDITTLAALEMDKAKTNAENAYIWKTWNGEVPKSQTSVQPDNFLLPNNQPSIPSTALAEDLNKQVMQMRKVLGSKVLSIKNGEEMVMPTNTSPSAAQQWLWLLTIEKIAVKRGIPMVLVLPDSVQGTTVRAILDDANKGFQRKFRKMAQFERSVARYFASWAIYNVPGLTDPPFDWKRFHITPPAACNVDKGRDTIGNIAGIAAGTRSYDEVANESGTSAHEVFTRKANNIADAKLIAAKVSTLKGVEVSPEEIINPLADVAMVMAKAVPDDTDEEPKGNKNE
jgi:capsid protein